MRFGLSFSPDVDEPLSGLHVHQGGPDVGEHGLLMRFEAPLSVPDRQLWRMIHISGSTQVRTCRGDKAERRRRRGHGE
jgi:hypothetical protein